MVGLGSLRVEVEKLVASEAPVDPVAVHELRVMLDYAWTRACEEYDRAEAWRDDGFASAASALRARCGVAQGVARRTIDLGRKLRTTLPETARAWARGEISGAHAQVIANAYTPGRTAALRALELEEAFVDAARAAPPPVLAGVVRRATDAIDGDGGADAEARRRERRRFHMSRTLDGMWAGDFLLDDEDGLTVQAAIERMRGNYARTEVRSPAQQRADAFVELCAVGADHTPGGIGHAHADIAVRIDLGDLEAQGRDDLAADIRALRGAPLPRVVLDRLACDARVWRVLTDGASQVLDVGRATRVFTAAQRRAILARDEVCTGCGAPGAWCEFHHVVPWQHGGATSVANGRLVCRPCHRRLHERSSRGPAPARSRASPTTFAAA